MAANRYGIIWHGRNNINVRFPSPDARKTFAEEFEEYHQAHDHDGEPPRFESVAASKLRSYEKIHDIESVTIDGYSGREIKDYHENEEKRYLRYKPPTCCVPPLIVIDHKIVESGNLERHELSSIFGDMPDTDYKSLLESVQRDGFIDETIKLLDGKVLDGWHRYRAGKELNFLRKLKFQQWDEKDNGDPQAFVLARNIERRHLNASQRAQIVVTFNERFTRGDIETQRNGTPNGEPKTRQELAEEAGVGTSTIDRAVKVEQKGESEAVISGEKTATEVISEAD